MKETKKKLYIVYILVATNKPIITEGKIIYKHKEPDCFTRRDAIATGRKSL